MAVNLRRSNSTGASILEPSQPLPINPMEKEHVDMLTSMMSNTDETTALRVLRKHRGDIHAAASAMLEGDTGEAPKITFSTPTRPTSPKNGRRAGQGSPVIDLTGEEEDAELARALKASLETVHDTSQVRTVNFGPSDRAPDPNWAIVPSNVAVQTSTPLELSQEDHTLQRVMQESLNDTYGGASVEEPALDERVRLDGRPVAFRASEASLMYASLLVHALFFVPQVRSRIAAWWPKQPPGTSQYVHPHSDPERALWLLTEAYTNMDMAYISELESDRMLEAFGARQWDSTAAGSVRVLSRQLLTDMVKVIEPLLIGQEAPRLFSFRYGNTPKDLSSMSPEYAPSDANSPDPVIDQTTPLFPSSVQETCIVDVELDHPLAPEGQEDDLISRLSAQLSYSVQGQQVIIDPSEVVVFQLSRSGSGRGGIVGTKETKLFRYPMHIFLDQFMASNAELAASKRASAIEMDKKLAKLTAEKRSMRWFKGNDTLKNLRASVYYYEHVAQPTDPERGEMIATMADKLKKILAKIEGQLVDIDAQITKLQKDLKGLFDVPELQQQRYDLRVVMMHDGLFGRRQTYTYVQDKGVWWRIIDNEVTQVLEEDVLTDAAGLHLGAGPYMLMYSRALTPQEQEKYNSDIDWPEIFKASVRHNNEVFLSALSPEARARFKEHNEPEVMHTMDTPQKEEMVSQTVSAEPQDKVEEELKEVREA